MAGRGGSPKFGDIYRRKSDGITVLVLGKRPGFVTQEGFPGGQGDYVTLTLDRGATVSPFWPLHETGSSHLDDSPYWEKIDE